MFSVFCLDHVLVSAKANEKSRGEGVARPPVPFPERVSDHSIGDLRRRVDDLQNGLSAISVKLTALSDALRGDLAARVASLADRCFAALDERTALSNELFKDSVAELGQLVAHASGVLADCGAAAATSTTEHAASPAAGVRPDAGFFGTLYFVRLVRLEILPL